MHGMGRWFIVMHQDLNVSAEVVKSAGLLPADGIGINFHRH